MSLRHWLRIDLPRFAYDVAFLTNSIAHFDMALRTEFKDAG